ncbi:MULTISPECIES: arabinose ABC transporter substrate-binding protein [Clostridium]|uniref:arabinose ABC transporter substrate-binding protein n=1 Tax=Clostridium TaxID=1485 RepID=UPI00069F8356|nr:MULTISPECIES: arabinose ABC transporter substrate-binding protein [Clostridium]KOF57696.1 LacI family transcriptional regulator [Clostridium sp. DMHC 10]MCD2348453.1 arabinose ABC transporter substrate-binding protein [Clostridium guangxiense]
MNRKLLLALFMIFTTLIFSCDTVPSKEITKKSDLVIAVVYKTLDEAWFQEESEAAKNQALKMGAKEVITIDAKMNPDVYLSALDSLITQKVDGILICIPDQKLSKITIDRCKKSNIAVIACDDPLTDNEGNYLAPFVGIDSSKIGRDMTNFLVDYLKKNNKLTNLESSGLLLMSMDSVSSCIPRTEGQLETFKNKLPSFPKENIFQAEYNGQSEKSFYSAASTITNNKNIKNWFIMSANEAGTIGAIKALEQSGLSRNAVAVGVGNYVAKDEFQKEKSPLIASAYISATKVGQIAAQELMENLLLNKNIPKKYLVKDKIITKDNYQNLILK